MAAKKKSGRFVVYKLATTGRSDHTLGRFHKKELAKKFAQIESIKRECSVYVDEIFGKNKGEPIATYTSGRSMRI
jgi:hypothetical protein